MVTVLDQDTKSLQHAFILIKFTILWKLNKKKKENVYCYSEMTMKLEFPKNLTEKIFEKCWKIALHLNFDFFHL